MNRSIRLACAGAVVLALGACNAAQDKTVETALASAPGQLFCAIQTTGGGSIVVGIVDASATKASPTAAPLAVIATGATKAFVDDYCARAAGARIGIPVAPPVNPAVVPQIAVTAPIA